MSKQTENVSADARGLTRYLSPLGVWALSFGCAVGWGAFVMPGTTFLPIAGPLGTTLGIMAGALIMVVIGVNYHYLINKYPGPGGTLTYAAKQFGYDHGFLSAWFLVLVYFAIIWANATALALIARNLLGRTFQFGFHYRILNYDVYCGEALLAIGGLVLFGLICIRSKRLAVGIQSVLALTLLIGILVCGVAVMKKTGGVMPAPAFAPGKGKSAAQVLSIVALTPWAFAGFESVSNSAAGFKFSPKKSFLIMAAALAAGAYAYVTLSNMAAAALPEGYASWVEYIAALDSLEGLEALPTFYAAKAAMGDAGLVVLGVTVTAGVITGLIGNYIAASRLLYAMAKDGILPRWFAVLNKDNDPRNALLFLMGVSVFIPFLGRTTIGWIVDVTTIGAIIAYAYTSAAAFSAARRAGKKAVRVTGAVGVATAILFFFYFMSWNANAMATESYLILAGWSILGFVYSRFMFSRDKRRRFGRSTVVWIGALFLIFFTTLMWLKQATQDVTGQVLDDLNAYNAYELSEHGVTPDEAERAADDAYLQEQMERVNRTLTKNSIIQMGFILLALAMMLSIYSTMRKREEEQMEQRILAEESSKAKTSFLSNMSHDIRTPMNAIIGYTNLARREGTNAAEMRAYLDKIDSSSHHLLALINDVLEMSRIESGKMALEPVPVDLCKTMDEVRDMFATQMTEKGIDFTVDTADVETKHVMCDKNRFNRVLLNLLSNACKFTPSGGSISVVFRETGAVGETLRGYELRVRDSGIGMTQEFAAKVFEAFERERTSTVSGIQGTGLGMAITKNIIDMMGGTIDLVTAPGQGTEFIIRVAFEPCAAGADEEERREEHAEPRDSFEGLHVLLVEDNEINREIATILLKEAGFTVSTAENGEDAVRQVAASAPGEFAVVLMDIQMPVMNGYDATRTIRALPDPAQAEIPIVAMTANAFAEDISAAWDAGMDAHVAKPVDAVKLMETLAEVLRRGPHRDESL